jgi:hypothetical protein
VGSVGGPEQAHSQHSRVKSLVVSHDSSWHTSQ